jgi:adenosylhomocysteine nucleosidase
MWASKPLIVMALPQESRGRLEAAGAQVLYTGVGKVNAAATLARRLAELRIQGAALPLVVNMGTAGSRRVPTRSLIACNRFAQRDMDVSGLGFPPGVTPFDPTPPVIEFPPVFQQLPQMMCSTADSFATQPHEGDVVDMEAFAFARVCLMESARFGCIKYVTDGADGSAGKDWAAALEGASQAFAEAYHRLALRP